ncbi:hypothetical protein GCM10010228_78890 [Streptomyces massasporeus]|nr:hypothetical protein GCM10010228_78890 [Streptomyces massasporeus]
MRAALGQLGDQGVDVGAEAGLVLLRLGVVVETVPQGGHTIFPVLIHRTTLAQECTPGQRDFEHGGLRSRIEGESLLPGLRAACVRIVP